MQRTCLVDRTCSDAASASAHFVHCRGAPPVSLELSQRTALGILTPHCPGAPTPQSSGARFSGIAASSG